METSSSPLESPSSLESRGAPPVQTSSSKLSREEEAKQVLEHTVISPLVSWLLIGSFLLSILFVPTVQFIAKVHERQPVLPSLSRAGVVPQGDELKGFENDLEKQSVVAGWALPPTQSVLTRLGVGNEKATVGRDGWLAFRPDLDYVGGRGFLEPDASAGKNGGESNDAVATIVRFKNQLARRGISLVVMPTPLKPMIEPQQFSARQSFAAPLQNPSFADFVAQLQQHQVLVYDPTPTLFEAKRQSGEAQFLRTDTHWTPQAMQSAAAELAAFIQKNVSLPLVSTSYTRREVEQSGQGDIARMLKLPGGQTTFPLQSVNLEQVEDGEQPWRSSENADVLLLGDSFSNIYSRAGMGWGTGAGLAEQLSFELRRPLDVIAINAGGSYSTRRRLRDELLRGNDRLAGKRVVVWQFAMRDLQSGNWQPLDLPDSTQAGNNVTTLVKSPLSGIKPLAGSILRPPNPEVETRFRGIVFRKAEAVEASGSRVLHGSDGWLFLLSDVYYVADKGFLEVKPNPQIEALVDFKRQLERRGIKLLVVPAPSKSTIYPEKMGISDLELPQAPQNPSFAEFQQALEARGIAVFDPTETLLRQKSASSAPLYMPTDSHWTFDAMERTAAQLAAQLQPQLPARAPVIYSRRPAPVKNITDISMMLPRQANNEQFVRVSQTIQQVFSPDGKLWRPASDSDVLVMGDSFVNTYSHGGFWGKGAGFAEQLSYYLQRPVDLIAMDHGAINPTRRALQLDMQGGNDRLAGKKLVIYEVAARYLMDPKWRKIALPDVKSKSRSSSTPPAPLADPLAGQVVRGTIAARSDVPEASTTPYPDLVMTVRLSNVHLASSPTQAQTSDIVVYTWGLRGAERTPAASWKEGQTVTMRLSPWSSVKQDFGSYDRTDLEGDAVAQLKAYWATGS